MNTTTPTLHASIENDFAGYAKYMQECIKHHQMLMESNVTEMQSAAKDLIRLATQALEAAQALQQGMPYQPNLGDHMEGVVERYKSAERNMRQQALQAKSFEHMLAKAAETFGK